MGKIGKNLRKYFTLGALGLATLFAGEVNAQAVPLNGPTSLDVIGNTFSQPNVQVQLGRGRLDWYGSGDVNDDGKIDSLDVSAIDSGIKNDRSDVTGDGITNAEDANTIFDYLNGRIPYLPGYWNELTKEGKISWLEKMIKVDSLDTKVGYLRSLGWVCKDITMQEQINFYGISNIDEFIRDNKATGGTDFSKEHNARFNIPVYQFSTQSNIPGELHGIEGVLVENYLDKNLSFNDWYKFSVYNSEDRLNLKPNDWEMQDGSVSVGLEAYVKYPFVPNPVFDFVTDLVKWNLKDGEATLESYSNYLVLHNPNIIKVHADSLEDFIANYKTDLDISPDGLKSLGYNSIPDYTTENTELTPVFSYKYSDKVPLSEEYPDINYSVDATGYWTIESGGVVKQDSTKWKFSVADIEKPKADFPKDTTIFEDEKLEPSVTGYPVNISDNSGLPVNVIYNDSLAYEDSTKKVYGRFWKVADVFDNDTLAVQKINVMKSKMYISKLEDILLNYRKNQDLSPEALEKMGYKAIPNVKVENSTVTPVFRYFDSDTTALSEEHPEIEYQFNRTYFYTQTLPNRTLKDSTENKIIVKDLEAPPINAPEDTIISKDSELKPSVTGYPWIGEDNSGLPVDTTYKYEFVPSESDSTKGVYNAYWTATDKFGNDSTVVQKVTKDLTTAVLDNKEAENNLPKDFKVYQNYPNPFNPSTTIKYDLPKYSANFKIDIYDIQGELVRTLKGDRSAGTHEIKWNGKNEFNQYVGSGVYILRAVAGDKVELEKMILVK